MIQWMSRAVWRVVLARVFRVEARAGTSVSPSSSRMGVVIVEAAPAFVVVSGQWLHVGDLLFNRVHLQLFFESNTSVCKGIDHDVTLALGMIKIQDSRLLR